MNLEQLEKILNEINIIDVLLNEDLDDTGDIGIDLSELRDTVTIELKGILWKQYQAKREQQ